MIMASFYRVKSRTLHRVVDDESVILDLDVGEYFGLNAVGTRIWECLGEGKPTAAIALILASEFEVSQEQAEEDLSAFLEDLSGSGLIFPTDNEQPVNG